MRLPVLWILFATLSLAGCHGGNAPTPPGGSTPVAALQSTVDLLKAGDLNGLWKHLLPPADYANLRADWALQRSHALPGSTAQRARFNETMQKLTAANAENTLNAELQPRLAAMQQKYGDQLPVLMSVGEAIVKSSLAQGQALDPTSGAELGKMLDALLPWAQQAPWFDPARARQAIGVTVATARRLDLKDAGQLQQLDFDATMNRYSIACVGIKQGLAIYGLSIDDALDSVRLSPVSSSPGHAVVKFDYTLAGKPLSGEARLVEENGRWYSERLLQNVRRAHRQMLLQATVADAAMGANTDLTQD